MKLRGMILSVFLGLLAVTGITLCVNVNAATPLTLSGTTYKVNVTRNVINVTNPVTNTFGFTITPDASNPAAVTGAPTSLTIAYDGTETISNKTVTKTVPIDFSGTTFTEVGDYKFKVTETSSSDPTTYPVSGNEYFVYVSVRYDTAANDGSMTATVLGKGTLTSSTSKVDVIFPANTAFTNISVTKNVTGDMGDITKYFPIKVTVPGSTGDKFKVTGGSYSTNPTEITGNTETVIYLKNGETVKIGYDPDTALNQIRIGSNYTVKEDAVEHYTTTIDNEETNTVTKTTNTDPDTNKTVVVNDYQSASLTGLLLNVMPFILLIGTAIIGLVLITRKKVTNNI